MSSGRLYIDHYSDVFCHCQRRPISTNACAFWQSVAWSISFFLLSFFSIFLPYGVCSIHLWLGNYTDDPSMSSQPFFSSIIRALVICGLVIILMFPLFFIVFLPNNMGTGNMLPDDYTNDSSGF